MDDSDDYFYDDFVLDEQTLAALDQAEQNYQKSLPQPSAHSVPVNKRHKTDTGWTAGPGANYLHNDDFDDLPDISVRGDGSYSIRSTTKQNPGTRPKAVETHAISMVPSAGPSSSTLQPPLQRVAQPLIPHSRPTIHSKAVAPGQGTVNKNKERVASEFGQPSQLEKQFKELQEKLEELREQNVIAQSALKKAVEERVIKDGEVSILRKNIETSAQIHSAQIAQLKAEKEQADAKRLQVQIKMDKELEALRSDYKFKEQELAASVRKAAPTRGNKGHRDFPATPLPPPRAGRSDTQDLSESSASRRVPEETPFRPFRPIPPIFKASPTKNIRRSPEKRKVSLPGFENAFDTPMRSPSKRDNRKEKVKPLLDADSNDNPFSVSTLPAPAFAITQPSQDVVIRDVSTSNFYPAVDEEMDVVIQETDENVPEAEHLDWINWKAELCRIILTHSPPTSNEITFQWLLRSLNVVENTKSYSTCCARILTVLSTSLRADDYESSLLIICASLQSILVSLYHAKQLVPLSALFDLLTELTSIPTFLKIILSLSSSKEEGPSIVSIFQNVILEHLSPEKILTNTELACSLLTLLESICFHPSPSSTEQLQLLFQNRDILLHLVQSPYPSWFLERSFRLLALLSTHHDIWGVLLGPSPHDGSKDVLIDRLCSHLLDTSKPATEIYKLYILVFFTQMSIAHPGAHTTLIESHTLIPSLIFFTSHLTNPLWEDDDRLVSSREALRMLVQSINQTVCLLYRLVFATDPCVNLRSRIQQAHIRPFSILLPTFTVSFGRLSYAEPPSWVDTESRQELESIAEVVRDLLELVIDGPEGDSVWATFQDEDSTADAEDLEARFIGND